MQQVLRRFKTMPVTFSAMILITIILVSCKGTGQEPLTDDTGLNNQNDTVCYPEGSVLSPLDIGSASGGSVLHDGSVILHMNSFYVVSATIGEHYRVTLSGLSENADLYLYDNSAFTSLVVSGVESGTSVEERIVESTGSSLYIMVVLKSGTGTMFSLELEELPSGGTAPGPETAINLGTITTSASEDGEIEWIDFDTGFDSDWWQFSITSTQTVTIETSQLGPEIFDTEIWLYSVDTTLAEVEYTWAGTGSDLIASNDDDYPSLYSQIQQSLDAGTYVVRVSHATYAGSPGEGVYSISVSVP